MKCGGCVRTVENLLKHIEGVSSVQIDLQGKLAEVSGSDQLSENQLLSAFEGNQSFTASSVSEKSCTFSSREAEKPVLEQSAPEAPGNDRQLSLQIHGMDCASCVRAVETALGRTPGVINATVNFATGGARIGLSESADQQETLQSAISAVRKAGYSAEVRSQGAAAGSVAGETTAWRSRALWAAAFFIPVIVIEMGHHWFPAAMHFPGRLTIVFLLTTAVMITAGRHFFVNGGRALLRGNFHMDALIALGSGTAYLYSTIIYAGTFFETTIGGGVQHFESAAGIVALVSIGKWLELRARDRAGSSIKALAELAAKKARVIRNGEELEISAEDIRVGDEMIVRPGEKIPTDGEVISGDSEVDESLVTGESMPVAKTTGSEVTGSSLNGSGALRVRATKVGGDTMLAQIIALVERAQENKTNVQRMADRVSAVFIPAVIVIAAITFAAWLIAGDLNAAIIHAVTVLIVACPCALGLATPTAIMAGTGRGAHLGVLLRDPTAIETAGKLDVLILDKTGTITEGKPSVTDVLPVEDERENLLRKAAAVELLSEHPLAEAVVREAKAHHLELPEGEGFQSVAGQGVSAKVEGIIIRLGNRGFMESNGISLPEKWQEQIAAMETEGKTALLCAEGTDFSGVIALADTIKSNAQQAVKRLESLGLEVWMITGDNPRAAAAIARQAGIPEERVMAEVSPADKEAKVAELQAAGRRVAMAGDGVNDAPALARAELGIAMGSGSHVAMETGAITLVSGDLRGVVRAIRLSRMTMGKIRQNLFWAFIYNTLLIPAAALGAFAPYMAAAAMALSDIFVIGNSMLLNRAKPD